MFDVPFTYVYSFGELNERCRRVAMHEFARCGARHLVLTDELIRDILTQPRMIKDLEAAMSAEGLTFLDAHAPFEFYRDMNCPDERLRPVMLEMQRSSIAICAAMGVNTITIHIGANSWRPGPGLPYAPAPDADIDHVMSRVRRSLDVLLPFAESNGVVICIENVWHESCAANRLLQLKSYFPSDALGFCFDAGHANISSRNRDNAPSVARDSWAANGKDVIWDETIQQKMLPHIVNCHLHDNHGLTDEHDNFGTGNVNWPRVCELLHQAPRLRCIQSEVLGVKNKRSIAEVVEAMNRFIQ